MARLIDACATVELDPMVAALPVVEFAEDTTEMEFVLTPRKTSGARLDRSFELVEWFES